MKRFIKALFRPSPSVLTIGLTFLVLVLFSRGVPLLDMVELKTFDLRFLSRGVRKPTPEVVLAVIDEKSLDAEGRWPWPRSKMARLTDRLSADGAKVISFDIIFSEPDENSTLELIRRFERKLQDFQVSNPQLQRFLAQSKIGADNDLALATAIRQSRAAVVLGHFFHMSQSALRYQIDPQQIEVQIGRIQNSRYPVILSEEKEMGFDPFITAYAPEASLEILARAAAGSGYLNMFPDPDGVVRHLPLVVRCGQEGFAPLSVATVWHYLDRPQLMVKLAGSGIQGIRMGERFLSTDERGELLLNYLGPAGTFPHYSATDILRGRVASGTFAGKIVLVGSTALGIYDMRNTPFDPLFPGVEIHATVIDNILRENFLHKPQWTRLYNALAILLLGFLTGLGLPRLGPLKGTLFASGLFALHVSLTHWLFTHRHLWLNMVYPLLALVLVFTALTVYHYLVEEKNRRFLYTTFSSYLSPEVIEEMVNSQTMPELGGEARSCTAFFTDIQAFSTFSEQLTAPQVVELLNEYLTAMTDILIAESGTLDKYEGDAIVAFLGAPMPLPDHALRACRVAVSMQDTLGQLREKWSREKQLPTETDRNTKNLSPALWRPGDKWPKVVHGMRMRIGINSGQIVVGNMGSAIRMNYTMMGDAVNLAARLEQGAKQFGIYTAVSEHTLNAEFTDNGGQRRRVMDAVEVRFIDKITVVGKTEPVKVYELCAMKGGLSQQDRELIEIFNRGMAHYLEMEWDQAITRFRESLKIERFPDGETTPSRVFLRRCEEFKARPPVSPGEKWDGIYRMREK